MQHESRKRGSDDRADPTNETREEGNSVRDRVSFINVFQQNAVIITGKGMKRDKPEADESNPERWL